MKKNTTAGALLIAGVLALTACGGSAEGTDGASSASSSSPSASPSPTTKPVGSEQYQPEDLEEALLAVNTDQALGAKVIGDDQIRPELEGAGDVLQGITITPEQCAVFAAADIGELLDNATIAMMMLSPTDSLTVVSHSDAGVLETQVENDAKLLDDCAIFQMDAAGTVATATSTGVDASTDAEVTQAFVTTVSGAGSEDTTLQVAGISGSTRVHVNMTAPADTEAAVARAEKIIDAVLAELETK